MQCSYTKQRLTDSTNYTPICGSFALITERGTRLLKKTTRDASPPLEVAFGPQDRSHAYVLPDSSLCQNGKQVEIITKMIFELCYIEAIITNTNWFSTKALQRSR